VDSKEFLHQINNKINDKQNRELEKEVTEEEIREAIWSMPLEKAPGLDGFTIAFYNNHWASIKKYLVRMIKNAFKKNKVGENTKASHLALISKEPNPISFDRYGQSLYAIPLTKSSQKYWQID